MYSIQEIDRTDEDIMINLCGHILEIKIVYGGYAIPFSEESSLYMFFDSFTDAIQWYLNANGLWLEV